MTAEFDGEAEVWADGSEQKIISGRVDWREQRDWFNLYCRLHFQPRPDTSGRQVVRYEFD